MTTKDEQLKRFAEALERPDFSHVSHRSWCRVELYYIYLRDPSSPSGVQLAGFIDPSVMDAIEASPEADAIMAAHSRHVYAGGQMGNPGVI